MLREIGAASMVEGGEGEESEEHSTSTLLSFRVNFLKLHEMQLRAPKGISVQAEIDELTPSDAVVAITSAWGLSMRPPSNSLILSRRNREKRAQLAQQRDRRLCG